MAIAIDLFLWIAKAEEKQLSKLRISRIVSDERKQNENKYKNNRFVLLNIIDITVVEWKLNFKKWKIEAIPFSNAYWVDTNLNFVVSTILFSHSLCPLFPSWPVLNFHFIFFFFWFEPVLFIFNSKSNTLTHGPKRTVPLIKNFWCEKKRD